MKRKILLSLSLLTMLVFVLAISVSAGTFGEADDSANIPVGSVITDTESQIQMSDGKIYPAYYFFNDSTTAKFKFDSVKKSDGSAYTKGDIVKVEIPEGIVQFEDYNFTGGQCNLLEYVSFPSTVVTVTRQAFTNCSSLTSVTIPDTVKTIGPRAFSACKALTEVIISPTSQLTIIESEAFKNTAVQSFYFPNSLTTLGSAVFAYNEKNSLTTLVNFENCAVTYIPKELFRQCGGLQTIKFPKGITEINGSNLFSNCNIDTIYFPKTLQTISSPITAKSIGKVVFAALEGTLLPANFPTSTILEYANYCDVYCGSEHIESDEIIYTYIDENGNPNGVKFFSTFKISSPCGRNCGDETIIKLIDPLFTCLGYSAPEDGRGGIAIGFTVNNEAIKEYEKATGKTLKYGVFAVLKDRLGDNDVFSKDGTVAEGAINADITSYEFALFELKIVGFTDEQKDTKLAMGAYVAVTDDEGTEYSYMQGGEPNENEKYYFVSYNDIIGKQPANAEVTQ